eukprot:CAMPEP_0204298588 /NCGR_PEP_ID=MMETSP0468-20130131/75262_1 /ASSEMBLY_ACC=CAM_ASM_000383 /TAXON_ID=2969 /ORGANISM="Oxyrrhis marina" /LENGTH=38 /DNA_ID= /DNA_START= /DNA_END= /DNA_ORIENTATION=
MTTFGLVNMIIAVVCEQFEKAMKEDETLRGIGEEAQEE